MLYRATSWSHFFFLVQHYYYCCMVAPKSRNGYVKFDMHVKHKVGKFHQIIKSHNTASSGSIPTWNPTTISCFTLLLHACFPCTAIAVNYGNFFSTLATIICEGLAFYLPNPYSHVSSTLLYSGDLTGITFKHCPRLCLSRFSRKIPLN